MKRTSVGTDNNKGFTLFEVAVALTALALLTTAAIPFFIRQAEIAAAQKTAKEVSTIQEAAKWYYVNNKSWPASIGALQSAGFLNPSWSALNPWGNGYSISSNSTSFYVSTFIPSNVTGVLTRALPGPTVSGGTVTSVIPVPGQEASVTSVTNLANTALNTANNAMSMAQSSALPPYGGIASIGPNTGISIIWDCPEGYVIRGIGSNGSETVRSVRCQKIAR